MPTVKAQLLAEINKFLKETGMVDSRFSTEAVGDIMASTVDRVRKYMSRARKAS